MDDNQTQTLVSTKPRERVNPGAVLGGTFEDDETERTPTSTVPSPFIQAFAGAPTDLLNPTVSGIESVAKNSIDALVDLGKEIFNLNGSIENFQNPGPAQREAVEKQEEDQRKRMIFASLEEAKQNAQRFAHEANLNMTARLEVAGMPTVDKNRDLHLNLDYDEKNINNPYLITELMKKKKAQLQAKLEVEQSEELIQATGKATSTKGSIGPQVTTNLLDQENANQVSKLTG